MTAEIPGDANIPDEERNIANELLSSIDGLRTDPYFVQIMDDVTEAEADARHTTNPDKWWEMVHNLNDILEASGWLGEVVRYTGKLRVAPYQDNEEVEVAALTNTLPRGEDERGEYYELVDYPLALSVLTVDTTHRREVSSDNSFVYSFYSADELAEAQSEEDLDYMKTDDGRFIAYAGDISHIAFTTPSSMSTASMLEYHFPDVHKEMERVFGGQGQTGKSIWLALKNFELPTDNRHLDKEMLERIGNLIFESLQVDDQPYEFWLEGEMALYTDQGWDPSYAEPNEKMRAQIVGVRMGEVDNVYRAMLIVAKPRNKWNGGYEACMLPIDSIVKMRHTRTIREEMGATATYAFDSPESVMDALKEIDDAADRAAASKPSIDDMVAAREEDIFKDLTDTLGDVDDILYFDRERGVHVVSLEHDINKLVTDFKDHFRAIEEIAPEEPVTEFEIAAIAPMLNRTLERLNTLSVGDVIATRGTAVILDDNEETGWRDVIALGDDDVQFEGEFVSLAVGRFPVASLDHTEESGDELQTGDWGIGFELRNCYVVNEDGSREEVPFRSEIPVIAVSSATELTQFFKLEYNEEAHQEGN